MSKSLGPLAAQPVGGAVPGRAAISAASCGSATVRLCPSRETSGEQLSGGAPTRNAPCAIRGSGRLNFQIRADSLCGRFESAPIFMPLLYPSGAIRIVSLSPVRHFPAP
jgi:hypothetical protein